MNASTASSSQRGGTRDKKARKQLDVTCSSHGGATRAEKKLKKKAESSNQKWEEEVKQRQATYRHPTFDMMQHFLDFSRDKLAYTADFEAKEASEASRMADNCIVFDSRGNVLLRKFSSSYGLKKDAQQKLAEITDRLSAAYPPPRSGEEDGRVPKDRDGPVQRSGSYHFRSALVGQTKDTAEYSTPITGIFGPVCSFLLDLDHANQVLTGIFEYFEPDMFLEYREAIETLPPDRKVLFTGTSDKGVWCDRVVRINKNTHCHRELRDRKDGFSFMFTIGKFDGGDLCLPKLKLRIPFGSGSVIMLRSALLEHFVCPWEGEYRYQFTYSTHQDIFDWARDYKYATQKYNRR
ncbi:hypothetical protein CBR_g39081 [Chara braunii]|uniref:Uncharacterized protein n=1 Tax=Chara braunii TaxID=69332 RepID=A0A388LR21_CHABU|nr:hypothetical protein CBR_g39081 [Chara braunii]|eukprot:GBG84705.1 hypothetical protein CBR_g39081 [Chara braunii]